MAKPQQLSDLQLAILRVLWSREEASVAEVQEALKPERDLAPTTVATMLSRLEKRRVVTRRTEGRQFIYRPAVAEQDVRRSMVGALIERLFEGDPAALVSHLIDERELGAQDVNRLKRLVAARSKRKGGRRAR